MSVRKRNIKLLLETVTYIAATETVTCIITTEIVMCIIHSREYNLHNCNRDPPTCIISIKNCHPYIRWRNFQLHNFNGKIHQRYCSKKYYHHNCNRTSNLHNCNRLWYLHNCNRKSQLHSSNRNCHLQNWVTIKKLSEWSLRPSFRQNSFSITFIIQWRNSTVRFVSELRYIFIVSIFVSLCILQTK